MVKVDDASGDDGPRRQGLASRWLVVWMAAALALVGSVVGPGSLAHAVGNYDNGAIADVALRYLGQWGGNACRDAGKYQSGQCKQFVNCVVSMASGGAQYPAPGYHSGFQNAGAVEVSSANARRGDIIQIGNSDYAYPLHTAIVLENKGDGKFYVVDSNYSYEEVVKQHDWTAPSGARFWRLGTVKEIASSAIAWEAPTGWYAGQKITWDFTVTNRAGSAMPMGLLVLAVRDPQGRNVDQVCARDISVPAGGQYRCRVASSWSSAGTYSYWVSWMKPDGSWHNPSPAVSGSFRLGEKLPVEISTPLELKLSSGAYVWSPVAKSFTVKNTSAKSVKLDMLVFAVRDPADKNYDKACATGLTLAPGATHSCSFTSGWGSVGTYRVWPSYYLNGTWYSPGAVQTFALKDAPGGISVTKPLVIKAAEGWLTGKPITSTMSVKNAGWQPIYLEHLIVATRDSSNRNVDQGCARKITLAPGETKDCTVVTKWSEPGTYSAAIAWSPNGTTWHQSYGASQSFQISRPKSLDATPEPVVSGTVQAGKTLTVQASEWKPSPVALSYQWLRDGAAIAGATGAEYKLVAADVGKKVSVKVTGSKAGYMTVSKTSAQTVAVAAAPKPTPTPSPSPSPKPTPSPSPKPTPSPSSPTPTPTPSPSGKEFTAVSVPRITGSVKVGKKLTADAGAWGPGEVALSYQWYRSGAKIAKATKPVYTLKAADKGKKITVKITGTKPGYTTVSKTSVATGKVAAGTLTSVKPKITGTVKIGKRLTAKPGTWKPSGVKLSYQWLRNGKAIKGATKSTYKLAKADKGKKITVKVTGKKAGYTTKSATSKATKKVG